MADDIVTRLRTQRDEDGYCVICGDGRWESHFPKCLMCEAADEIERARAEVDLKGYRLDDALDEIERLRMLGDTMAHFVRAGDGTEMFAAVHAWVEARRG